MLFLMNKSDYITQIMNNEFLHLGDFIPAAR